MKNSDAALPGFPDGFELRAVVEDAAKYILGVPANRRHEFIARFATAMYGEFGRYLPEQHRDLVGTFVKQLAVIIDDRVDELEADAAVSPRH